VVGGGLTLPRVLPWLLGRFSRSCGAFGDLLGGLRLSAAALLVVWGCCGALCGASAVGVYNYIGGGFRALWGLLGVSPWALWSPPLPRLPVLRFKALPRLVV